MTTMVGSTFTRNDFATSCPLVRLSNERRFDFRQVLTTSASSSVTPNNVKDKRFDCSFSNEGTSDSHEKHHVAQKLRTVTFPASSLKWTVLLSLVFKVKFGAS
jgi:hypothetical protein